MMGPKQEAQAALFYEFLLEDHVPQDHLLPSIDRFVGLDGNRAYLADFSATPIGHRRSGTADPDAAGGVLLRHPIQTAAL